MAVLVNGWQIYFSANYRYYNNNNDNYCHYCSLIILVIMVLIHNSLIITNYVFIY